MRFCIGRWCDFARTIPNHRIKTSCVPVSRPQNRIAADSVHPLPVIVPCPPIADMDKVITAREPKTYHRIGNLRILGPCQTIFSDLHVETRVVSSPMHNSALSCTTKLPLPLLRSSTSPVKTKRSSPITGRLLVCAHGDAPPRVESAKSPENLADFSLQVSNFGSAAGARDWEVYGARWVVGFP